MVYDPWGGALEHYGVWVYVENGLVSDGLVRAIGKQPRGICKEATHDAFADENSIHFTGVHLQLESLHVLDELLADGNCLV